MGLTAQQPGGLLPRSENSLHADTRKIAVHPDSSPGCMALAPAGVQRPARHRSIKVVAAELRVPVRRQHLEDALQRRTLSASCCCMRGCCK
jgi:hypothetical protein